MVELTVVEDFRCAPWTREQGVDPIGSATRYDALLLVEWPLPWPRDVAEIPALAEAAADTRATVLAVVPQPDAVGADRVRVVHRRRVASHRFEGVDHLVPRAEVPALLAALLDENDSPHLELPSAVGPSPEDVLVCGHGRRDRCCGRWGTLLQVELVARVPQARVWRCSHTGGHRFAPTAITAADGRAWAFADVDLLAGIIERTTPVAALAGHHRGSASVPMWAQPVEHALFLEHGWAWDRNELTDVAVELSADGRRAEVTMAWAEPGGATHEARAEVVVLREVPVLVCGEPPEAADKSSFELGITSLAVRATG